MLLWHQAQPSSKLAAISKAGFIANCGDERRCGDRTDPFNLADTLAHLIGTVEAFDPLIVASEACIQFGQLLPDVAQHLDKEPTKASRPTVRNFAKGTPDAVDISRHHDTVLPKQTSDLVHEPGTICNHTLADTVNRLDFQLLRRLRRYKPHRRPANRLANSFSVIAVILVRLDIRLHELRRDQPDLVPQISHNTCPIVRSAASLHSDNTRLKLGEELRNGFASRSARKDRFQTRRR